MRLRAGLPVDRLPDDCLLDGYGRGDDELSVAFVRRFQGKVYGVALAICRDPSLAEDVAQQAFERAWVHAPVYDPRRGTVNSWMNVITRNLAIDAGRRTTALPVDPGELLNLLVSPGEGPESAAVRADGRRELRAALAALPVAQARCLVMAAICGMTATEIADAEAIPLGTAKTRIRTAMQKLRGSMAGVDSSRGAASGGVALGIVGGDPDA